MTTRTLKTPLAPWPSKWRNAYSLEGRTYWMQFAWNDRDGFWYMTIASNNMEVQAEGITMNIGTDKLEPFKYADVPQGRLDVVDTDGRFVEPSRTDMGTRVVLQYTDFVAVEVEGRELFPFISVGPPQ
jgi:hypothetical protein